MSLTLAEVLNNIDERAIDNALQIINGNEEKDKHQLLLDKEEFGIYTVKTIKYTIKYGFRSISAMAIGGEETIFGQMMIGSVYDSQDNPITDITNIKDEIHKIVAKDRDFSPNDIER